MNGENVLDRLKNAKNGDEVKEILEGLKASKKLSLDDLDHVAGGAPSVFVVDGDSISPAELLSNVKEIRKRYGYEQAMIVLNAFVGPYYSAASYDQIVYAYERYGSDMFKFLDNPTWQDGAESGTCPGQGMPHEGGTV